MNEVQAIAKKLLGTLNHTERVWMSLKKRQNVTARQLFEQASGEIPGHYKESHISHVLYRLVLTKRATREWLHTSDSSRWAWHYTALEDDL